jgi:putative phosphoribosyl transferase
VDSPEKPLLNDGLERYRFTDESDRMIFAHQAGAQGLAEGWLVRVFVIFPLTLINLTSLQEGVVAMGISPTLTVHQDIVMRSGPIVLEGRLDVPENSKGLVIFAHGSGSSRFSPRNAIVAESLQNAGLATLLMDLLTDAEAESRSNVFDIDLLADRILIAADAMAKRKETKSLPLSLFGASTGAAAALVAAAREPARFSSVVSRGGRPDLASGYLPFVKCPTLLIVGGLDLDVIELNRSAQNQLKAESELVIVPGATHLFQEEGALEQVCELACRWFVSRL